MLTRFGFAARSHKRNSEYQFWTHENHAIEVYSNSLIQSKVEYIHNNPVRAGIVNKAEDYKYSSAGNYAEQESLLEIIPDVLNWKTMR